MKCERCQIRDAQVRLDQMVEGQREQHFFCTECAEEIMRGVARMSGGPHQVRDRTSLEPMADRPERGPHRRRLLRENRRAKHRRSTISGVI